MKTDKKHLVIDTSVAIKWLNQDNEKDIDKADQILLDVKEGIVTLLAPELLKYEAGNVLLHGKKLTAGQASICLTALYSLPITFVVQSEVSAAETFILAKRAGITYYDAAFIALANDFSAWLVTDNIKHQGKAKNTKVMALRDYSSSKCL